MGFFSSFFLILLHEASGLLKFPGKFRKKGSENVPILLIIQKKKIVQGGNPPSHVSFLIFIVLGHSMGGLITVLSAMEDAEKVVIQT